jgi:hypothetical protein
LRADSLVIVSDTLVVTGTNYSAHSSIEELQAGRRDKVAALQTNGVKRLDMNNATW